MGIEQWTRDRSDRRFDPCAVCVCDRAEVIELAADGHPDSVDIGSRSA